jgi:hypothetical protein
MSVVTGKWYNITIAGILKAAKALQCTEITILPSNVRYFLLFLGIIIIAPFCYCHKHIVIGSVGLATKNKSNQNLLHFTKLSLLLLVFVLTFRQEYDDCSRISSVFYYIL